MNAYCPRCHHPRPTPFGAYFKPWTPVRCDNCGESTQAGSWEEADGSPIGDPHEPEKDYCFRPPTVFVSYTHRDREHPTLKKLTDDLMFRARVNVWIDTQRVLPGSSIHDVVTTGIHTADYFVYVVSKGTGQTGWTAEEFHIAYAQQTKERRLKIVPVLIDQVRLPSFLDGVEYVDMTGDYESGYRKLILMFGSGYLEPLGTLDLGSLEPGTEIVKVCHFVDGKLLEALRNSPSDLYLLSPRWFEQLVAKIFDGLGYVVELTKRTRDGGRDVIAVKKSEVNLRFLIECKRFEKGKTIGVRPVRELFGVKMDEGATKAILATTAYFSKDARLFFARHAWELEGRDYDGIISWLHDYSLTKRPMGI